MMSCTLPGFMKTLESTGSAPHAMSPRAPNAREELLILETCETDVNRQTGTAVAAHVECDE